MNALQASSLISSSVLIPLCVDTGVFFLATHITNIALRDMFSDFSALRQSSHRIALLTTVVAALYANMSIIATIMGVALFILSHRSSLKSRLLSHLKYKDVQAFIHEAIQYEKPALIKQLYRFILNQPKYTTGNVAGSYRLGLTICFQEQIISSIIQFNKLHLVKDFFNLTTNLPDPLVGVNHLALIDEETKFNLLAIHNETVISQIKGNRDLRIRALELPPLSAATTAFLGTCKIGNDLCIEIVDFHPLQLNLEQHPFNQEDLAPRFSF